MCKNDKEKNIELTTAKANPIRLCVKKKKLFPVRLAIKQEILEKIASEGYIPETAEKQQFLNATDYDARALRTGYVYIYYADGHDVPEETSDKQKGQWFIYKYHATTEQEDTAEAPISGAKAQQFMLVDWHRGDESKSFTYHTVSEFPYIELPCSIDEVDIAFSAYPWTPALLENLENSGDKYRAKFMHKVNLLSEGTAQVRAISQLATLCPDCHPNTPAPEDIKDNKTRQANIGKLLDHTLERLNETLPEDRLVALDDECGVQQDIAAYHMDFKAQVDKAQVIYQLPLTTATLIDGLQEESIPEKYKKGGSDDVLINPKRPIETNDFMRLLDTNVEYEESSRKVIYADYKKAAYASEINSDKGRDIREAIKKDFKVTEALPDGRLFDVFVWLSKYQYKEMQHLAEAQKQLLDKTRIPQQAQAIADLVHVYFTKIIEQAKTASTETSIDTGVTQKLNALNTLFDHHFYFVHQGVGGMSVSDQGQKTLINWLADKSGTLFTLSQVTWGVLAAFEQLSDHYRFETAYFQRMTSEITTIFFASPAGNGSISDRPRIFTQKFTKKFREKIISRLSDSQASLTSKKLTNFTKGEIKALSLKLNEITIPLAHTVYQDLLENIEATSTQKEFVWQKKGAGALGATQKTSHKVTPIFKYSETTMRHSNTGAKLFASAALMFLCFSEGSTKFSSFNALFNSKEATILFNGLSIADLSTASVFSPAKAQDLAKALEASDDVTKVATGALKNTVRNNLRALGPYLAVFSVLMGASLAHEGWLQDDDAMIYSGIFSAVGGTSLLAGTIAQGVGYVAAGVAISAIFFWAAVAMALLSLIVGFFTLTEVEKWIKHSFWGRSGNYWGGTDVNDDKSWYDFSDHLWLVKRPEQLETQVKNLKLDDKKYGNMESNTRIELSRFINLIAQLTIDPIQQGILTIHFKHFAQLDIKDIDLSKLELEVTYPQSDYAWASFKAISGKLQLDPRKFSHFALPILEPGNTQWVKNKEKQVAKMSFNANHALVALRNMFKDYPSKRYALDHLYYSLSVSLPQLYQPSNASPITSNTITILVSDLGESP